MLFTIAGIVFITLGVAIGWYGFRRLAVVPKILYADVRNPSEVTEAGSFIVCHGVAKVSSETVTAPFTGAQCLGFEFEVTERQPAGIGIPWFHAHLDDGVATRSFTLDGPYGALSILPSAKRFALDTESSLISLSADESPPEPIQRFVDSREVLNPVGKWMRLIPGLGMRRYIERRIDPGEEYLIAGRTEREQNEIVLSGDLIITDRTPRKFVIERLRKAVFPVVIAIIFIAVGIGAIIL